MTYGMSVPLGVGCTLRIEFDALSATATAVIVDDCDQEPIGGGDFVMLADAILSTWFLEREFGVAGAKVQKYKRAQGWTVDGWYSSFSSRLEVLVVEGGGIYDAV